MPEQENKLPDAIEQLAVQIVMMEPNNLKTLGSFLEQLKQVEKIEFGGGQKSISILLVAMKEIVEKIILNELRAPQEGIDLLGRGIKIIQTRISHPGAPPLSEEENFWMDGIIVRIGDEQYIVPALFIKETLRPRPEDITTVHQKGHLVKVRDTLLPLIRLHHLLGVIPEKEEPWEALLIVVENEGVKKCLMVDDLIGKQEVVIKSLGEKFKDIQGVAGATIMGNGHVGLILDIHGIFRIYEKM